ncbi:MAG: M20/M25/M40 family metallo-hydrolase, partial [Deltaproteobacteria bacterium]
PDSCVLQVGVRQLPGQTGAELVDTIAEAVEAVARRWRDRGGRIETTMDQEAPALSTPAGTPLEALLRPHARDPRPTAVPFATDGGNLTRAGVRSIVFGPGSIDVAHRPDEYIAVDQLLACVDIVRRVVVDRCGARPL